MQIISPAFVHEQVIPRKYSCQGEDINPPLEIKGIPEGTESLALIFDDPDVPEWVRKDRMWVHWVVYNIDPKTSKIEENSPPFGMAGKNSSGQEGYMGPCPPDREHRYFFKLYALDTRLELSAGATKEELLRAMEGHLLGESQLMGRYVKS